MNVCSVTKLDFMCNATSVSSCTFSKRTSLSFLFFWFATVMSATTFVKTHDNAVGSLLALLTSPLSLADLRYIGFFGYSTALSFCHLSVL